MTLAARIRASEGYPPVNSIRNTSGEAKKMNHVSRRGLRTSIATLAMSVIVRAIGWGHPVADLGINHFTRLDVTVEHLKVRYVVTMSEIATYAELRAAGIKNVDSPTSDELAAYATRAAFTLSRGLVIHRNGRPVDLGLVSRSVSMPPGARGFKTLRLELQFEGNSELSGGSIGRFRFDDRNYVGHGGWHEVVVVPGTDLTVFGSSAFGSQATDELRGDPAQWVGRPLDERVAEFSVIRGSAPAGAALLRTRDGRAIGKAKRAFAAPTAGAAVAGATGVAILLIPLSRRLVGRRQTATGRTIWKTWSVCAVGGLAACAMYAAPASQAGAAGASRLRISLVNAATGNPVAGVIRVSAADGQVVPLEGLISRGQGLADAKPINEWSVLAQEHEVHVPQQKLQIDAFAGLGSALATINLDLAAKAEAAVKLPVRFFGDAVPNGWYAANTHLHLRNLTAEQAERYLREVPAADQLDVLFISYLERAGDDRTYITNRYPVGDFARAWNTTTLLNNGEEHRHNFGSYGEGFGHVLLLNINTLIAPVSIGPGITGAADDGVPLRPGIDEARRQGGTAIWAHNASGFEDVPNFAMRRLDALNIFDGGSAGKYEDSFYHYLNAGLQVPFSTGTDWFIGDLARVYADVRGTLTIQSWLEALKAGRTFITNGPLFDFSVDGVGIGGTLALESAREIRVRGRATGRRNFGKLQLVENGRVIDEIAAAPSDGRFEATLDRRVATVGPCWLALRVSTTARNEYGAELFGHTSPVYVTIGGARVRIQQDVEWLIRDMEQAIETITARGTFANESHRERVLAVYREGIAVLRGTQGER
jgi:hypothetical protein